MAQKLLVLQNSDHKWPNNSLSPRAGHLSLSPSPPFAVSHPPLPPRLPRHRLPESSAPPPAATRAAAPPAARGPRPLLLARRARASRRSPPPTEPHLPPAAACRPWPLLLAGERAPPAGAVPTHAAAANPRTRTAGCRPDRPSWRPAAGARQLANQLHCPIAIPFPHWSVLLFQNMKQFRNMIFMVECS